MSGLRRCHWNRKSSTVNGSSFFFLNTGVLTVRPTTQFHSCCLSLASVSSHCTDTLFLCFIALGLVFLAPPVAFCPPEVLFAAEWQVLQVTRSEGFLHPSHFITTLLTASPGRWTVSCFWPLGGKKVPFLGRCSALWLQLTRVCGVFWARKIGNPNYKKFWLSWVRVVILQVTPVLERLYCLRYFYRVTFMYLSRRCFCPNYCQVENAGSPCPWGELWLWALLKGPSMQSLC